MKEEELLELIAQYNVTVQGNIDNVIFSYINDYAEAKEFKLRPSQYHEARKLLHDFIHEGKVERRKHELNQTELFNFDDLQS